MIKISFNGEVESLAESCTVQQLLESKGFDASKVAVAMNLELVPRSEFPSCVIEQDCELDVLAAVQGG